MNWNLFAVIVELICILVLDIVIFKLRKQIKSVSQSAEIIQSKANRFCAERDKLQAILDGERVPSKYCLGCKYSFLYRSFPGSDYGCAKNIRCKEYEMMKKEGS